MAALGELLRLASKEGFGSRGFLPFIDGLYDAARDAGAYGGSAPAALASSPHQKDTLKFAKHWRHWSMSVFLLRSASSIGQVPPDDSFQSACTS